jgi:hypothetical protein
MKHECHSTPFEPSLERYNNINELMQAAVPNAEAREATPARARSFIRSNSEGRIETLFSSVREGALLIAALSYGLEVPIRQLRTMRVRDVNTAAQAVIVGSKVYQIPRAIQDDLKEYLHEKLCGYEVSIGSSRRDQLLFSEVEWRTFEAQFISLWRGFLSNADGVDEAMRVSALRTSRRLHDDNVSHESELFNRALCLMARFHRRRAKRAGIDLVSALELLDKGPRIVRRGRSGIIQAYYAWRVQLSWTERDRFVGERRRSRREPASLRAQKRGIS